MLKSSPTKKTSFGFASKPSKLSRDFNPGRFLSGLTKAHYPKGLSPNASVIHKHAKLVDWLRKKHGDDDDAMDLADRLDNCEPNKRCLSAACPCCTYAGQAFTTEVVLKFLTSHPDRAKIVCVSVVPADGAIPAGQLNTFATSAVGKTPSVVPASPGFSARQIGVSTSTLTVGTRHPGSSISTALPSPTTSRRSKRVSRSSSHPPMRSHVLPR
jgi:hypothetical protein